MSKVIFGALLALVAVCSSAVAQQCCEDQGSVFWDYTPMVTESYDEGFVFGDGIVEGEIVELEQPMFVSEMPVYEASFTQEPLVEFVEMPIINETPVYWHGETSECCCCEGLDNAFYGDATALHGNVFYGEDIAYTGEAVVIDDAQPVIFQASLEATEIDGVVEEAEETFTSSAVVEAEEDEQVVEATDDEESEFSDESDEVDSDVDSDDEESADDEEDDNVFGDDDSSEDE